MKSIMKENDTNQHKIITGYTMRYFHSEYD